METVIIFLFIGIIILGFILIGRQKNITKNNINSHKNDKALEYLNSFLSRNMIPIYSGTSPIILRKDEYLVICSDAQYYEERSIRNYFGGSFRVARGFYLHSGQSESNITLKIIDSGKLSLTNQRLIFTGLKRTCVSELKTILMIQLYKDSIGINKSGKQKSEIFEIDTPIIYKVLIEILSRHSVIRNNNYLQILN